MKTAVIVGHGPSALDGKLGEFIDAQDYVIRLKRCQESLKYPADYGTRTDILGGSYGIAGAIRQIPADHYWVWVDSRQDEPDVSIIETLFYGHTVDVDINLCRFWDSAYMRRRDKVDQYEKHEQMEQSQYADEYGEKHLSQGFKAIVYAAEKLDVDKIYLVGFDNMMTGEFTWSITRGPDFDQYATHRWDIEHEMLPQVEIVYGKKIIFKVPEITHEQD